MATEDFTRQNHRIIAAVNSLADESDFDVTAEKVSAEYGSFDVTTYIVGGSCDIKYLQTGDGDFASPDANTTLDSFSSAGISEGNATPVLSNRTAVRLTNTSGGPADFTVILIENPIDD